VISFSTSGTTNRPMQVRKFKSDYYRQLKNLCKQRFDTYGIKSTDRSLIVLLESIHSDVIYTEKNKMYANASFFSEDWLKKNAERISDFMPVYVMGFTGSFMRLIHLYRSLGQEFSRSVRFIELIGEPVFSYQKRIISKMVPDAVIIENYSCTELQGVALSCPRGNMHLLPSNAVVEIDNPDENGIGDILLTSLHSKLMPFIRYRIGDKGSIKPGSTCECGNANDIIEIAKGRTVEYLYFEGTKPVHMMVIHKVIEDINEKVSDSIEKFQLHQIDNKSMVFNICLNQKMLSVKPIVEAMLIQIMQRILGNLVRCSVEFVDMKSFTDERKAKYFVNEGTHDTNTDRQ